MKWIFIMIGKKYYLEIVEAIIGWKTNADGGMNIKDGTCSGCMILKDVHVQFILPYLMLADGHQTLNVIWTEVQMIHLTVNFIKEQYIVLFCLNQRKFINKLLLQLLLI